MEIEADRRTSKQIEIAICSLVFFIFWLAISVAQAQSDKTEEVMTLCSGGLSKRTAIKLSILLKDSAGDFGAGTERKIVGAIFADTSISSPDKVQIYNDYVSCVETIYEDVHAKRLPPQAKTLIKKVVEADNWGKTGWLSRYDFVDEYDRRYKNEGPTPISCHYQIRGELQGIDAMHNRFFEADAHDFTLHPGETEEFGGTIGVSGGTDSEHYVTSDERLQCWYVGVENSDN
jgi:hypothetical protein